MTQPVLAASNVLLDTGPSAVQGVLVLLFVALVAAREVQRVRDPRSRALWQLERSVTVLAPVVLVMLAVRLLVILQ